MKLYNMNKAFHRYIYLNVTTHTFPINRAVARVKRAPVQYFFGVPSLILLYSINIRLCILNQLNCPSIRLLKTYLYLITSSP